MPQRLMIRYRIIDAGGYQIGMTYAHLNEGDVVALPAYFPAPVPATPSGMVPEVVGRFVEDAPDLRPYVDWL